MTTSAAARWHRGDHDPRCGTGFADIDADHGDRCVEFLRHGVLLVLERPLPASRAGRAGARPDHPINGHFRQRAGWLLSRPLIVDPLPSPVGANGSDACVELGLNSYS